jgi:hypothetical protein
VTGRNIKWIIIVMAVLLLWIYFLSKIVPA